MQFWRLLVFDTRIYRMNDVYWYIFCPQSIYFGRSTYHYIDLIRRLQLYNIAEELPGRYFIYQGNVFGRNSKIKASLYIVSNNIHQYVFIYFMMSNFTIISTRALYIQYSNKGGFGKIIVLTFKLNNANWYQAIFISH